MIGDTATVLFSAKYDDDPLESGVPYFQTDPSYIFTKPRKISFDMCTVAGFIPRNDGTSGPQGLTKNGPYPEMDIICGWFVTAFQNQTTPYYGDINL